MGPAPGDYKPPRETLDAPTAKWPRSQREFLQIEDKPGPGDYATEDLESVSKENQ